MEIKETKPVKKARIKINEEYINEAWLKICPNERN